MYKVKVESKKGALDMTLKTAEAKITKNQFSKLLAYGAVNTKLGYMTLVKG